MIESKVFRTFIIIHSLFKSLRLSANIKLNLDKTLIRSVITYACSDWELTADTYHLKMQCLQNKVLRTTGNFPRCTPVRDLHTAFNLSKTGTLFSFVRLQNFSLREEWNINPFEKKEL
jgi:hypothetical protein